MITPIEVRETVNELNTQLHGTWIALNEMNFVRDDGLMIYVRLERERYSAGFSQRVKGEWYEVYHSELDPTLPYGKYVAPTISTARKLGIANLVRNLSRRIIPEADKIWAIVLKKAGALEDRTAKFYKDFREVEAKFLVSDKMEDQRVRDHVGRAEVNLYRSPFYDKVSKVNVLHEETEVTFRVRHEQKAFMDEFIALIKKHRGVK